MLLLLLCTLAATNAYRVFNWHNELTVVPWREEGPQRSKLISIMTKIADNYRSRDTKEVNAIFDEYYQFFEDRKNTLGIRSEYIILDDVKLAFRGMRFHIHVASS